MNVVRPAVQKENRTTVYRARLRVPHAQQARIDLFQWTERGIRADLCPRGSESCERRGGKGHCGGAEETAASVVEVQGQLNLRSPCDHDCVWRIYGTKVSCRSRCEVMFRMRVWMPLEDVRSVIA